MQVKTVTVVYSMTCNLGNYSNTRQSVSLTAELDEGDNEDQALSRLRYQASEHIIQAIAQTKRDYQSANNPPEYQPAKLDDDYVPFA